MISIDDLVMAGPGPSAVPAVDMDPLGEDDALQEAQLLDSRVCQLASVAVLLFELRTALQIDVGNAGLLVVRGLRSFAWNSSKMPTPLTALTVISSVPERSDGSFRARLDFYPDAQLDLVGDVAEFYVLDVEGIGDTPPDYSDADRRSIQTALPSWSSRGDLLRATRSRRAG